jgi:hypothetical protein
LKATQTKLGIIVSRRSQLFSIPVKSMTMPTFNIHLPK